MVRGLTLLRRNDLLRVYVDAPGDVPMAIWGKEPKVELWKHVFDVGLEFKIRVKRARHTTS
jgi:hypothetical protein